MMALTRVYEEKKIDVGVSLTILDCPKCGGVFGITGHFEDRRREDGENFYCPAGHVMSYGDSQVARLRKQVKERDESYDRLYGLYDERQKELARVKRRAKAGVCQSCHRHFANVERHYQTQHGGAGRES